MEGYPSPYPYATIDQALVEAQTALQPPEALVFSEGHQVEHAAVAAVENLPTTRQPRTWYLRLATPPSLVVATNLYPVEATEQLASAARLLTAWINRAVIDRIAPEVVLTDGQVRDTAFVALDAIAPAVVLTSGSVYTQTVAATDSIAPAVVLTDGVVETTLFIVTYEHSGSTETLTSVGTLLSASLQ